MNLLVSIAICLEKSVEHKLNPELCPLSPVFEQCACVCIVLCVCVCLVCSHCYLHRSQHKIQLNAFALAHFQTTMPPTFTLLCLNDSTSEPVRGKNVYSTQVSFFIIIIIYFLNILP